MSAKVKSNPMRRALSFVLAALLVFSLVPAPAFAALDGQTSQEGASISLQGSEDSAGGQQADQLEEGEEPGAGGEVDGKQPVDGEESDELQTTDGTEADDAQEGDKSVGNGEQDADDGPASGSDEKQDVEAAAADNESDEAEALEYGRSLLMTASARAVADSANPNTPVKTGQYAPGTYTVTANLFIPQDKNPLINIQAYATNPDNPLSIVEDNDPSLVTGAVPNTHMEDNAQLVVEEDGTLLLTVPVLNPVFTIQKIGDGEGIKVVKVSTKAGEYGPVGPNGTVARVDYESRISSVTFELSDSGYTSDGSHGYTLKNCTEYPTLLGRDWDVDLDLTVDFSGVPAASKYVADPVVNELTYNGSAQQGVSFEEEKCEVVSGDVQAVNAGDYSLVIRPKEGITWLDGTTDARTFNWSIAKAPLVKRYETVIPCGNKSAQEIIDALPSADEVNAGFEYDGFVGGDTAETVEGLQTQTFVRWELGKLQWAQMVPLASCVPAALRGTMSGEDADTANYDVKTEAIAHVAMSEDQEPEAFDVVYNGQHQLGLRQADGNAWAFSSADSPYQNPTPWNDFSEGVLYNGLQVKSFVDVGTYTVELSPSETWLYADGYWPDGTNDPREYSFDITPATLTASVKDVYIHEGEEPSFNVEVSGFVAKENAGTAAGYEAPVASLANGVDASSLKAGETCEIVVSGGSAKNYKFEYENATLHVLAADTACLPQAVDGLVYSGKEQTGVADGSGYSVETGAATDAGTYQAVATLDEGVVKWADGSVERTRTVEWSIAKAPLTATYLNEIVCRSDIEAGNDWPAFRVHVEGFVNGESPANGTVADYVAPTLYRYAGGIDKTVTADEWQLTSAVNDIFIPDDGSAKNYEFVEYNRGKLWIVSYGSGIHRAAAPNVNIGLVYNGSEQVGIVPRVGSTILAQGSGIDAGTYTATVALDEDRTGWYLGPEEYWYGENEQPDESSEIIQIQWSIAKAPLSAKAKDVVITYGDTPQLEAEVTGFVNGEDASSAAGYEAPVVSLPKGVTVEDLEPGETYTLSVSGGAAGNYEFASYEPGTLTVLPKGEVADPAVAADLVYTGKEQQAIADNEAWTVSGGSAVNVGEYKATVTLNDGYVWADGSKEASKTFAWSIASAELTATYEGGEVAEGSEPSLSASVSGFVNGETAETAAGYEAPTVSLPDGVTADSLVAGQSYELTPAGGKADNYTFKYVAGTLKVTEAKKVLGPGTYTVTANLSMPGQYNPLLVGMTVYANNPDNPFTDNAGNAPVLDENDASEVHYTAPIAPLSMNAQLIVGEDGTKTLVLPIKNPVFTTQDLGTCKTLNNVKVERVAPADASNWDYGKYDTRIHLMSAELTDSLVDTGVASYVFTGSKLYAVPLDMDLTPDGDVALQLDVDYSGITKVSDSTDVPALDTGEDDPQQPGGQGGTKPGGSQGGSQGGGSQSTHKPGSVATTSDGHLAAGTYTVSANIWFDKATTGLPLNPHITNGSFPPKDPVSNNATLKVSKSGRATVTIPIRIQDRVMQMKSIKGLNIVDYTTSGGRITSITVDLGVLSSKDTVITKSCQVSVHIGDLAMTIASGIFNGVRDHTWNATFQLNFKGLPASGGGTMPAEALAALSGQDALADEGTAEAAALDALETPVSDDEDAAFGGQNGGVPVVPIAVGAIVLLAIIAAAAYAVRRRKSGGM